MLRTAFIFCVALMSATAFAGAVWLDPPAYPWQPGEAHSNVSQAFVTGFDANGHPTGICTYYAGYGRTGHPIYARCGWSLTGASLYLTPLDAAPVFAYSSDFDDIALPNGYTGSGWDQGSDAKGNAVYVVDVLPIRRSVLVTP
jgi:hypothetical protein